MDDVRAPKQCDPMRCPVVGVVAQIDHDKGEEQTPPLPRQRSRQANPPSDGAVSKRECRSVEGLRAKAEYTATQVADRDAQRACSACRMQVRGLSNNESQKRQQNGSGKFHNASLQSKVAVLNFRNGRTY